MAKMAKFWAFFIFLSVSFGLSTCQTVKKGLNKRQYNGPYSGPSLNRVAFPIGGMGAGMFCLEGTGAISHVSVKNVLQFFNEPCTFAAITIKQEKNVARILEGPVPAWKIFGAPGTGNGAAGSSYGLPRFKEASFLSRFPFGIVSLEDPHIPLDVTLTGWSPFIPGDANNSSLPVGGLEYSFKNNTDSVVEALFSFNTKNFMAISGEGNGVLPIKNGFVLYQRGTEEKPEDEGALAIFVEENSAVVDHCWFKGGWWDALTLAWENIQEARILDNPPVEGPVPGISLFLPLTLAPGQEKTVRVKIAWYVPLTNLRYGQDPEEIPPPGEEAVCMSPYHVPWYAGMFEDIYSVAGYWRSNYDDLREKTQIFTDTFYDTTLPGEVVEAVAANLTILKSPTVLRQTDGRLWCFEGCSDDRGCCSGSCTHVWNYAQAIPHLFPDLERSLRLTEFNDSQDDRGHQTFRSALPIRPVAHSFHAASDGQLGGIMKVYRDWRISGDTEWLRALWPKVKQSLDYCIETWDPRGNGVLEEPHHNTYDIEYWGPDGHCSSFYLGALKAAVEIGKILEENVSAYEDLLARGTNYLETELFNGEYFYQKIQTEGLNAEFKPLDYSNNGLGYTDIIKKLNNEGPKYQYGTGCLSDGVLGFWIAQVCGLGEIADGKKVRSHLNAVHAYNLKHDLSEHANPQRPSFAAGTDGGLLLCTWPRGGKLSIPFVYSDEVWTGIEYQVASHLMLEGDVDKGLEIVRICRDRYDGTVRNPFDEYECGHWYARALSSYGLIQGLTGVRYDAVDKTLYIDSRIGENFTSFLSTASGFGSVGLKNGEPFLEMKGGSLDVEHVLVSGKEMELKKGE
ncbi:MAG: non-lysosomal glucosylceramidase [Candidatus Aminicenantes bacterium]|nr:non-lysosomal glucosylceramidase [Candidatus Aminicenantes bacterium]